MPFLRSTTKPIFLFIPILLIISFLLFLSNVSVVEGDCTEEKNHTLIIGVPIIRGFAQNFVKITPSNSKNPDEKSYSGFCIEVFEQAVQRILGYDRPYKFVEFYGTYDELVQMVTNKTYCAAVGDITITKGRCKKVDFTVPFTESGVSMVVPVKPSPKAWIFLKPFTLRMWLATAAVLVYTMFIVWFIFSSLFLAHRERIQSNYARIVVVVVWLFLALILAQSYTANFTSILTIRRLQPIRWYLTAKVGCDGSPFMYNYVKNVLKYQSVSLLTHEDEYLRAFKVANISAAFLEIPYAKVFKNRFCKDFTMIGTTYRFGGFGFIFQKGSSLVPNVSEAILQLSESGTLKRLEEKWLTPNKVCLKSHQNMTQNYTTDENVDSFSLQSF